VTIIERPSTSLAYTSPRRAGLGLVLAACLALGCANCPAPPAEAPTVATESDPSQTPAAESSPPDEADATEAAPAPAAPAATEAAEPAPTETPAPDPLLTPDPDPMAAPDPAPAAAARRPAPAPAEPEPVYTDFAEFWRHFRNGLLKPDFTGLARLTTFPVTTRGQSDRDPVGSVDRTQFSQLIRRLLAQDVGESSKQEPLSDYLKRTQAAPPNAVTGPTARVTHLQFALAANGWRFVGASLSD
jgi:hypothetical protein